jgi:hypothetical protein
VEVSFGCLGPQEEQFTSHQCRKKSLQRVSHFPVLFSCQRANFETRRSAFSFNNQRLGMHELFAEFPQQHIHSKLQ